MARILVVDDSSLSRKTSRRMLEAAGHVVTDVADGFAALEQFSLDRPDVVLLDITMTEMGGLEVLRQLRLIDPAARVVMATADVQGSTRELSLAGGAVGFVTKPLDAAVLQAAVTAGLKGTEE